MAIDHCRVLVVYNTNPALVADSLANVEYFASVRGLRDAGTGYFHRLGFDFGSNLNSRMAPEGVSLDNHSTTGTVTTPFLTLKPTEATTAAGPTTAYAGMPLMAALAAFIADHRIDALVLDCNLPHSVYLTPFKESDGFTPFKMPTPSFLSMAPSWPGLVNIVSAGLSFVDSGVTGMSYRTFSAVRAQLRGKTRKPGSAFVDGNLLTGVFPPSPYLNRFKDFNRGIAVACGLLGYPGSSPAEVRRIVDDAAWAEQQDNRGKRHLVGGYPYAYTNVPYDNVSCNALFRQLNFTNLAYWDKDSAFAEYSGQKLQYASYLAGTLAVAAFGMTYGNGDQNLYNYYGAGPHPTYRGDDYGVTVNGPIFNACQPLRGGWAFAWQSSALLQGQCTLMKGGTAAVCNIMEPFADGLPGQLEVSATLLAGLSFAEACFLSNEMQVANTTVYGDPLYRPYYSTPNAPSEFHQG